MGSSCFSNRHRPAGSQCSRQKVHVSLRVILLLLTAKLSWPSASLYALLWCCFSLFKCLDRQFCSGTTAVRKISVLDTQSQPSEHESLPWHGQEIFQSPFPNLSLPQALLQNLAGACRGPVQGLSKGWHTNQAHMDTLEQMLNILLLFFSNFPSGLSVRHDFVFAHHGLHRKSMLLLYL